MGYIFITDHEVLILFSITIFSCLYNHTVKKKHIKQKEDIESNLLATLQGKSKAYDKVVLKWEKKLITEQENLAVEREKWQGKINEQYEKLGRANNRLHNAKQKNRDII